MPTEHKETYKHIIHPNIAYLGIPRQHLFVIEIFILPFGIFGASQFSQSRLQGRRMLGGPIGTVTMQNIQGLQGRSRILFGHFLPQLAQDGIVNVDARRDLIGNTDQAFHVLAFDGRIIRSRGFEHDLFQFGTGQSLDFAVECRGQARRGFASRTNAGRQTRFDRGWIRKISGKGTPSLGQGRSRCFPDTRTSAGRPTSVRDHISSSVGRTSSAWWGSTTTTTSGRRRRRTAFATATTGSRSRWFKVVIFSLGCKLVFLVIVCGCWWWSSPLGRRSTLVAAWRRSFSSCSWRSSGGCLGTWPPAFGTSRVIVFLFFGIGVFWWISERILLFFLYRRLIIEIVFPAIFVLFQDSWYSTTRRGWRRTTTATTTAA